MTKGAVLISGAAGGIGRATVDRFLDAGYEVAGIDIDPAVESLRSDGYRGAVADVREPAQLASACDRLLEGTSLQHVVGLAGRNVDDEPYVVQQPLDEGVRGFKTSLALNLTGQYALVHCCFERLAAAEGNRSITLCSSTNALRSHGAPGYSAAKAGLIGMMNAVSSQFARRGIRVNVVAPGTTRSPLTEGLAERHRDPRTFDRAAKRIPLGRVGEPDDVAAVIEALADRMTYVTGETIAIDGGHILTPPPDPGPRNLRSTGRRLRARVRLRTRIRQAWHNRPFR